MTNFLRFTTTDDRTVYLDPDHIIMISEHRYRTNDIGYVGSTITFHVGTAPSSINVKDDPEEVYHYLRKADLVNDQEMFLSLYNSAVPTHPPQKTRVYKPDGTSYVYPNEQEPPAVCSDTPVLKPYTGPSIEDFIDYIDNHPINGQVLPKLKSLDHVIYKVNGQVYQILAVLRDNCYRIQGRNHSMSYPDEHVVHASKLTKCQPYRVRPEPSSYRHSPQETPPCNGNGEAQSTEE